MVFKNRFFSSKKSASDSAKSDGSNSPRTSGSDSPVRSDKKKVKSTKDEVQIGGGVSNFGCKQASSIKDGIQQLHQQVHNQEKKKEVKGKEVPISPIPPKLRCSNSSKGQDTSTGVSPILASSLGLNRIKTRSGPLLQENFFGFRGDKPSNLSRLAVDGCSSSSSFSGKSNGKKKELNSSSKIGENAAVATAASGGSWVDNGSNFDSMSTGSGQSRDQSPNVQVRTRLNNAESSAETGKFNSSWGHSGCLRSDVCTPEPIFDCDTPKESESPRFQALLRVTSAPRRRAPSDIKSFSHELNSKGVRPFPLWRPRGLNNLEEVLVVIRAKFDKAKEEVDSDLAVLAGDLVGNLEKNSDTYPDWQETIEDLLVLARRCAMMSPGEFWLQCEGIVQDLDDRRQELPMGTLKKLHTRMLFILTRCTRLLQFHKESGLAEDAHGFGLRQSRVMHSADKRVASGPLGDEKIVAAPKGPKTTSQRKFFSQEQRGFGWKNPVQPADILPPTTVVETKDLDSPVDGRNKMASWKKLPSPAVKGPKETLPLHGQYDSKMDSSETLSRTGSLDADLVSVKPLPELPPAKEVVHTSVASKHQHKVSWGYPGSQPSLYDENTIICRICEEDVPTSHVEEHSRICTIADRCDQKGLSVNERLIRIADTLDKMMESFSSQKDLQNTVESPDVAKNSSVTEESDILSPKLSDWSRRGSEDMLDCLPETDNSVLMDDLKGLPSMSCKTRFGLKSDQGMTTSSAGSMTPRSPLLTPRTSPIDLFLTGKGTYPEHEDIPQMNDLADIARCVANTSMHDDRSVSYLVTCLEDLRVVVDRRKLDAYTVETFGTRIEKLIREKYLQLCELVDDEKVDFSSTTIDEDGPMEDDVVRSLRTSPVHSSKDRTSIDDFEIIKPISRGAFGRVFLAKKRTTGDLFAIKVLKKADMIRKNAVESILAERDILISVRYPFVVRFFYSFTCRENLYLVMEYLNGGDLYSLLRNLGCLDEDVARVYIAEVVLALEYLHSLHVVHRDLKPDNLLIAHDGHIKLTDFGLSKVGLINSTDDLSGPAVSGTSILEEDDPQQSGSDPSEPMHHQQRREKRSAVGTPDYLAPEILLGTGHGTTADWWSVGVILFELIIGIPPFNAEHPQIIFDNILNRNIPWPGVPEEMSFEAQDLIDRLLTEDPNQRLGANGASEVKQHVFFKDINWDTLARQKAAFVPASDSALDTSYFTSRFSWNTSDERVYAPSEFEYSSDSGSTSGSSTCSNRQDELGDECGGLTEFDSGQSFKYSFSNFSFKNLSQLASINYDLTKGFKDDTPGNPDA
ncbi:hypothetical protein MKX01_008365 [Papaver californicum]|nr:hypothetical protein MKX01_008365 [Papaver californicum]